MADKASLDDLYSDSERSATSRAEGKQPAAPEPEGTDVEAPLEAKTDTPEPANEPDKAADKGEPPAKAAKKDKDAPPASEEDDDGDIPADAVGLRQAVKAERDKRRDWKSKAVAIEAELAALRASREAEAKELAEYRAHAQRLATQGHQQPQTQQPTKPAPQPPDYYTDPEGRAAWDRQQMENAIRERELATQQALYERSAETSRRLMKMQHADYDDVEKVFVEAAQKDPAILENLVKHPFPAEYAYTVGKEMRARQEIQKAGSLEALIEQRAAAKLAEMQAQAAAAQPTAPRAAPPQSRAAQPAPPPQSLAGVTSMAPRTRQPNTGPTPLADLYKQ